MSNGQTFVDDLLVSVADGAIDRDGVALRWFGDGYPGARGDGRGSRVREEVTFTELVVRVERTAAELRALGVRPGERVLFSIRPRPEGVILCLAVIHAGGSIVFVDPGSTPELFEARLAAADPRWAASEALLYAVSSGPLARVARARGLLLPEYARLPVRHLYSGRWLPGVPRGALRVARLGGAGPADRATSVRDSVAPQDREALVVFTSGTTSDPRAVVHTTASLGGMLGLFAQLGELRPGQRAHTDQMFLGLPAILAGGTWEIPARTPAADPAAFARGVAGADSSFAVPADVTALLDVVEEGRRGGVRLGPSAKGSGGSRGPAGSVEGPRVMAVGAAPVTPALMERAVRVLPETRWVCVYGATEMLPAAVVDGADKAAAGVPPGGAVTGALATGDLIGDPLRGVTARIDAPDDDGVGELVISGPSLMAGYLADLDAGRAPAAEHRTGDLARVDDAGRLTLVGRTRDMIIRGTVNIYPGLFEPRVRALPGVAEALMVGVPMDDGNERVVLVLVADRGQVGGVNLMEDTALVRAVEPRLPGILDHGALPDLVAEASHVPLAGRSRKPDRAAVAAAAAPLVRKSACG
ncbi:class I adenylate-forming enzyme family protein [Myceligenerans xiligouense]|uniref:Acyl-CoA synthetase (AMP-forming)/AMP-acid ligase II n=1 Tax=Myceligenerans xiligouense TaxID=253184 RepID=A0A3N4YP70_9MICO|nr:class I adenylate-forming enzyme family protein [Myceligenerans xiligouense]RPF20280.1 acyl-CoA synthetase (AMP-forming)/AMP-acid ligase II [Myceligenerans xiligouense]